MEIESWLRRLNEAVKAFSLKGCVTRVGEEAWVLGPTSWEPGQKITQTVLAGVHGNEWAGVAALVHWLEENPSLNAFTGIAVGNPRAVRKRVRFIETDLNRAFGSHEQDSYERKRAAELSVMLQATERLLDLHQTILASMQAFFIFPWNEASGDLAASLHHDLQIVTHRGGGFSKEGQCTDEYVIAHGGVGVTLETGCQGLDPEQIALGSEMIDALMKLPKHLIKHPKHVLETQQTVKWSEGAKLLPGWENFMPVRKGETLGTCSDGKILAEVDGALLFPKYPTQNPPPAELCRVVGQAHWYRV
ncbi:MAG: succinylglutamate desuccinylase/aspartoacylase family protein [Oligoflexales bacterium]